MKVSNISMLASLLLAVLPLSGCDWVRSLAGRPVSSEIQAMRLERDAEIAREQAVQDSLRLAAEAAAREAADSLAAVEGFSSLGVYFRHPSEMHGISSESLEFRYHIAVGAFRQASNAQRMMAKFSPEHAARPVSASSGLNLVLVCPSNRIGDVYGSYIELSRAGLLPKEAWILCKDENE